VDGSLGDANLITLAVNRLSLSAIGLLLNSAVRFRVGDVGRVRLVTNRICKVASGRRIDMEHAGRERTGCVEKDDCKAARTY
jgi:hypothetical protein